MPDREKVINEWEAVLSRDPLDVPWDLIDETVTLLKQQEAERLEFIETVARLTAENERIVKCRDCKHGYRINASYCECTKGDPVSYVHRADWFCADGERR